MVCVILKMSPVRINRMLCDNGRDGCIIKMDEGSTLAKIAILNQLANGCVDYSTELRRRCVLLQVHMENSNLKEPNLTEIIRVALGQFTSEMFVKSISNAVETTDKFTRIVNHIAKEVVSLV